VKIQFNGRTIVRVEIKWLVGGFKVPDPNGPDRWHLTDPYTRHIYTYLCIIFSFQQNFVHATVHTPIRMMMGP